MEVEQGLFNAIVIALQVLDVPFDVSEGLVCYLLDGAVPIFRISHEVHLDDDEHWERIRGNLESAVLYDKLFNATLNVAGVESLAAILHGLYKNLEEPGGVYAHVSTGPRGFRIFQLLMRHGKQHLKLVIAEILRVSRVSDLLNQLF